MFKIFADAHKIIAKEMNENIFDIYKINLDEDSLIWGSILPDLLPKYKLIRHYKDESLDFVTKEIIKIIYSNRKLDIKGSIDPLSMKNLSRRIGIVSHYISDYTCLPHAKRWTFRDNMFKHLKYESKLNEYAKNHEFKSNKIETENLDIYEMDIETLNNNIKEYINNIIEEEYSLKESFSNDLNFSMSLNVKLTSFILNAIELYSREVERDFILEI